MSAEEQEVLRYYQRDGSDPTGVVIEALRGAGRDTDRIPIDDLADIDERSIGEGRLRLLQAVLRAD